MWASIDVLEQEVDGAPGGDQIGSFTRGCLAAVAEDVVDVLLDRQADVAERGRDRLQRILDGFVAMHGLEIEQTPGFAAGQLAAVTEVLAAASGRQLPMAFAEVWTGAADAMEEEERNKKYWPLIEALLVGESSSKALANKVNQKPETVSRKLASLREAGIVVSHKVGREVYSRLNLAAQDYFKRRLEAVQKGRSADEVLTKEAAKTLQMSEDSFPWFETIKRFGRESTCENTRQEFSKMALTLEQTNG